MIVNGSFLSRGNSATGVTRYANEIVRELITIRDGLEIYTSKYYEPNQSFSNPKYRTVGTRKGLLWEQLELPYYIGKLSSKDSILLSLENTCPIFSRNIVVIHDIIWKTHNFHSKKSLIYYNLLMPRVIRQALHIITDSEYSKSQIVKYFSIDPNNITVVPCAVPTSLTKYKNDQLISSINGSYILGSLNKNPLTLIKAFNRAKADYNLKLVLIGSQRIRVKSELNALISENDDIVVTGRVSDRELASLYSHAEVFVYPSMVDGFGIPPLEAMFFDCPVIASNAASIPEVVGESAITFDPMSIDELTDKINMVLGSNELAEDLRRKGKKRNMKFSWRYSAEKILDVVNSYEA